jgi:hypothetical protein
MMIQGTVLNQISKYCRKQPFIITEIKKLIPKIRIMVLNVSYIPCQGILRGNQTFKKMNY